MNFERPLASQTPEDMNQVFDALIQQQEEKAEKKTEEKEIEEKGFGIESEE